MESYCTQIRTSVTSLNGSLVSLTVPSIIGEVENGIVAFNSALPYAKSQITLQQWAPVIIFAVIILISIAGILALFFPNILLFVIVVIFFGIMFIFLLVAVFYGNVLSILLSEYCVGGTDNLTKLTINAMTNNNTCSADTLKYYLFCSWENYTHCDSFYDFESQINSKLSNISMMLFNEPNNTEVIEWTKIRNTLSNTLPLVNKLGSCDSTQKSYIQTTSLLCGNSTPSIIMTTLVLELLMGLIFMFFVTIRLFSKFSGTIEDDLNIPMNEKRKDSTKKKHS